ncbi:hypothetical protein CP03DC29_0387B, partial [Chlamydia psittaci 03DC29]
DGFST